MADKYVTTKSAFIMQVAWILNAQKVPDPVFEAARFLIDNPDMEKNLTPEEAADDFICGYEVDWRDPARYGAS